MIRNKRPNKVENMIISSGKVNAKVLENRSRPYEIEFCCRLWNQSQWQAALNILTSEAYYFAALMNEELPVKLEAEMTSHQLKCYPEQQEWSYSCTCSETTQPCKHSEAVYSEFSDRAVKDPLLLFVIRGLGKEQLMSQLRTIRSVKVKGIVKNEDDTSDSKSFSPSSEGENKLRSDQPSATFLSDVSDPEFWTKDKNLSQTLQSAYSKVGRKAKQILKARSYQSSERGDR